jgi:DNA-binding transcriptional regulator YdaS (Cro superfamily)
MQPLERAIKVVGGLSQLARKLEIEPQVIHNWRKRGIPASRVLDIERATADKSGRPRVLRHDLRPDIYPEREAA